LRERIRLNSDEAISVRQNEISSLLIEARLENVQYRRKATFELFQLHLLVLDLSLKVLHFLRKCFLINYH